VVENLKGCYIEIGDQLAFPRSEQGPKEMSLYSGEEMFRCDKKKNPPCQGGNGPLEELQGTW
jgi:hypothetical protein